MNTIEQALTDTKCAAASAVRAASSMRVRRVLTSMILLLLVLEPAISQAGLAKAQQPSPPPPSPTPTLSPASEELWPTNGWPTATPAEMGMNETKLKQARDFAVSQGEGSGFITRGGKLVLSWGSSSQPYALKSTTKSIGLTALGLAIKDGVMNLSDQAQHHHASIGVPPNSNSATGWLNDITLLHLATHSRLR